MAETVKMYKIDEEVMIKVKIANVEIVKGELKYRIRDTKSTDCLPYLYEDSDIIPIEKEKPEKKTK